MDMLSKSNINLAYEERLPKTSEKLKMLDITRDKPVKVSVKVAVPVRDHPKFNFVGKLLGPKGNSMKRLQEDTMCKMAVLGRGSMRDRKKEEELRASGDARYAHLFEDLHVEITTFAAPAEAHARIAYALAEVRRFLVPDYHDDIRQEQMWEMQALTSSSSTPNGTATPNNGSNCSHLDEQQQSPNVFRTENHVASDMDTCSDEKSSTDILLINDCTSTSTSQHVIESNNNYTNNKLIRTNSNNNNNNSNQCNINGNSSSNNNNMNSHNQQHHNNNNNNNNNNSNDSSSIDEHQILQHLLHNGVSNGNTDLGVATIVAATTTIPTVTPASSSIGDTSIHTTSTATASHANQVVSIHPTAMAVAALQHQLTAAGISNMLKTGGGTPTFTSSQAALPALSNEVDAAAAAAAAAAAITPSVASTLGLLDSGATMLHPALRGVKAINIAGAMGRKRPLLGVPRTTMNPTKRTVMTLLARAKNSQALQAIRPVSASAAATFADPLQMLASPFILPNPTHHHHHQAAMDQTMISLTKKNLAQSV